MQKIISTIKECMTGKTCCEETGADCSQGRACPVRAGTHKPAEAVHQIQEPAPETAMDALREAEAALEVAMARILKANPGHSISVTSEANALVAVRSALAATPAEKSNSVEFDGIKTAGPVVLPEPVGAMSATRPRTVAWNCMFTPEAGTKLYTEQQVRALLATGGQAQAVPKLDDAWKVRMLDGQPLVRDKDGIGYHPALPDFDEGVKCADFFSALGIELKCGMAENEMDSDAYEAMTENGLTEDGDNYNAWTPARPEGEGWNLVAVFDTEDGPACWWMRDKPAVPFHERVENYRTRVDNAAVEVLAMNMKAKLAVQRDKGYRGWNNDCTQQHLSDLLRQCVDKGDPVDVANFCAFLLARGETIAQLAAPVAAGEREAFEAWARSYGSWEVKRDDDQALGTTGYTDLTLTVAWHAIQGRAALAATPAAAPVDKSTELQGSMVDKNMNLQGLEAAPVARPEPDAAVKEVMVLVDELRILSIGHGQRFGGISTASDQAFDESANMLTHQSSAIESKLRALMAGVSAPAAMAVPLKLIEAINTACGGNDWQGDALVTELLEPACRAIASLAPQAQDVGRGEVLVTVSGFTGSGKSAIAGEIEILCRALGLQVEWPDGESEKNMTHADWTAALEQYKPHVRIVECNVPHSVVKGQDK